MYNSGGRNSSLIFVNLYERDHLIAHEEMPIHKKRSFRVSCIASSKVSRKFEVVFCLFVSVTQFLQTLNHEGVKKTPLIGTFQFSQQEECVFRRGVE